MKKILLGLFLLSSVAFGTPRIKIFRTTSGSPELLEKTVNNFIYNRKNTIRIIDIKYQTYKVDSISGTMDASIVLIYDRA